MEIAAEQQNIKELYNITKISGGRVSHITNVERHKSNCSHTIRGTGNKMVKHFQELLNRPTPEKTTDIVTAGENLMISLEATAMEDTKKPPYTKQ